MSTKDKLMERLEDKDFWGSIEYSKEDNCLFGQVLGLNNEICITYQGFTADELYNDFKAGIEHYLESCLIKGSKPVKSYNGILNILIPSEIHSRMAIYTQNNGTSINDFIQKSIERQLETV